MSNAGGNHVDRKSMVCDPNSPFAPVINIMAVNILDVKSYVDSISYVKSSNQLASCIHF